MQSCKLHPTQDPESLKVDENGLKYAQTSWLPSKSNLLCAIWPATRTFMSQIILPHPENCIPSCQTNPRCLLWRRNILCDEIVALEHWSKSLRTLTVRHCWVGCPAVLCVPSIVLGLVLLTNCTYEIAIWNKKETTNSIDRHKTLALSTVPPNWLLRKNSTSRLGIQEPCNKSDQITIPWSWVRSSWEVNHENNEL